jgi:peptidyl-prolyl cis-trans isomerase SurA
MRWLALSFAAAVMAQPVAAQVDSAVTDSGSVDRIVAVVGNAVILFSQVQEEILSQRMNGLQVPTDEAGLRQLNERVLSDLIDGELILQEAVNDTSIHVTDEEVSQAVDGQIRQQRRNLSEPQYRAELQREGFPTPEEYRRWLSDQQRRFFLRQRYMQHLREMGKLEKIQPNEREMRDYFETQKQSLSADQRKTPATISFRQIVIAPKPTSEARTAARAKADSIVQELRRGADFATAARRFSQDPVSAEKGGDLGWFRRGQMVAEFEREAFRLRPGVVSDPVESSFGYHIIQVQRIQPTEIQARHILIVPDVTQAAADSAKATADRLAELVRNGAAVDSLQLLFHDRGEEKQAQDVPADKLPESYAGLAQSDSGAVLVMKLPATPEVRSKFAVVRVDRRRAEGELGFEDVREQVRSALSEQLAIRRYLDRLRKYAFVEIRPI